MDFKNSGVMYALAAVVVVFVTAQSLFFLAKAWKRGRELGIETAKMKQTVISSALFSIAPAISILATVLALASALGYVLPWIRLSVIGNLAYETVAAEAALEALGTSMANSDLNTTEFSTVAWAMTVGSCFPLVLLPFLCKRIHKAMHKVLGDGREETAADGEKPKKKISANVGDILGAAAFIGIMAAFIARSIMGVQKDGPSAGFMTIAVLLSAMVFTVALDLLCKKKHLTKLEPFVLPIAMFGAMGIAVLLTQVLPSELTEFVWRAYNENGEIVWRACA
ncbi:MAG: DUF5058 family protein [Candidatus Fimenecus sp.]